MYILVWLKKRGRDDSFVDEFDRRGSLMMAYYPPVMRESEGAT